MRLCVSYSLALVLPEYNLHYIQANLGDLKQAMCEYQWLFGVVLDYHSSALHFSRVYNLSCLEMLLLQDCVCLCDYVQNERMLGLNNNLLSTMLQSNASENPLQYWQSLKVQFVLFKSVLRLILCHLNDTLEKKCVENQLDIFLWASIKNVTGHAFASSHSR